jgi:hypothetical protein
VAAAVAAGQSRNMKRRSKPTQTSTPNKKPADKQNKNFYAVLTDDESTGMDDETTSPPQTIQHEQVPPVVLNEPSEQVTTYLKLLRTNLEQDFEVKFRNGQPHIRCATMTDRAKLLSLLDAEKAEYHTYTPPSTKTVRLVIRGLPPAMSPSEIQEDLLQRNYHPIKVVQLYTAKTTEVNNQKITQKSRLPLFLVEFPPETNTADIKEIKHICHIIISWDPYRRPKGPTQCMRCQQLGHGTTNCRRQPRCVKCAGSHLTEQCGRNQNSPTPPTCANCGEAHPASYKGCKYYKEYINKQQTNRSQIIKGTNRQNNRKSFNFKQSNFPPLNHQQPQTAASPSSTAATQHRGQSYASATATQQTTTPLAVLTDILPLFSQLRELLRMFFESGLINKLKSLITRLSAATDTTERVMIIADFLMTFCNDD